MKIHFHAGLAFILLFSCLWASAAEVNYADLAGARGVTLPYAEPITLHGKLSQLRSADGETLAEWMDIRQLRIVYSVPGFPEQTTSAQIDPASGVWRALLKPLPQAAFVTLNFEIAGRLNEEGEQRVVERVLMDPAFFQTTNRFLSAVAGKSSRESTQLFMGYIEDVTPLIERALPPFLELKESGRLSAAEVLAVPAQRERFRRLVNLIPSFKGAAGLAQSKLNIGEAELADPARLYEQLEKRPRSEELPDDVKSFMKNFEAMRELVKSLLRRVSASATVSTELSVPAQVQDLQRYAGIDIAALYAPVIDELRQFILVSIYFGPVDDSPSPSFWKAGRWSLSVGMETGDLGGGGDAVIKDGKAYAVGLGFRLNKYFRLGAGSLIYRSSSNDELDRTGYMAISMDLTGFKVLQGLVSK